MRIGLSPPALALLALASACPAEASGDWQQERDIFGEFIVADFNTNFGRVEVVLECERRGRSSTSLGTMGFGFFDHSGRTFAVLPDTVQVQAEDGSLVALPSDLTRTTGVIEVAYARHPWIPPYRTHYLFTAHGTDEIELVENEVSRQFFADCYGEPQSN